MKTEMLKSISAFVLFASLIMVSCDREENLKQGTDTEEEQIVESASVAEDASDDALEMAYQTESEWAAYEGGRRSAVAVTCAILTHDEENKKITIDFGDGCVGPHGRERSGKIIIAYSHIIGDSLANRIITFENYFVNNKKIEGQIELRDVSINEAGYLQSVKRLVDLKISFPNGQSITFNGNRTREWLSGAGDGNPWNNVYRITGSITGIATNGRSFTHDIVEPIIADWSCAAAGKFARISGVVEMTKLGGYNNRKRTVEYGDGECDSVITITTIKRKYSVTI